MADPSDGTVLTPLPPRPKLDLRAPWRVKVSADTFGPANISRGLVYEVLDALGERVLAAYEPDDRSKKILYALAELPDLLSFIRDDLCDLADAVGADHWVEKRRREILKEKFGDA